MIVNELSVITVSGASWEFVQTALGGQVDDDGYRHVAGFANIPTGQDWIDLAAVALEAAGLDPNDAPRAILSATQPAFGAWRTMEPRNGSIVPKIPDTIGGEWRVLLPENTAWADWTSGGSGSIITIEAEEEGTWTVTGSFPVENGQRVEDWYFTCFMNAIETEPQRADSFKRDADDLDDIQHEFDTMIQQACMNAINAADADMHPWSIVGTNYLPDSREQYAREQEAIKAAGFIPEVRLATEDGSLSWIQACRPDGKIWVLGGLIPDAFGSDLRSRAAEITKRHPELRLNVIEFVAFSHAYPPEA